MAIKHLKYQPWSFLFHASVFLKFPASCEPSLWLLFSYGSFEQIDEIVKQIKRFAYIKVSNFLTLL